MTGTLLALTRDVSCARCLLVSRFYLTLVYTGIGIL